MGKKKKAAEEVVGPTLGRPGNNVKIGIVGLPNVGKSTLFNILSGLSVPAENYSFCTIDPTSAQVPLPDVRYDNLCEIFRPAKRFPATLQCHDIAGLVRGAHEGNGLGNEFLSNIAATDGIFHVVRAFSDKRIEHVDGDVDPIRDLETISTELRLKDLAIISAKHEKVAKLAERTRDKEQLFEVDTLVKILNVLENEQDVRHATWTSKEVDILNSYNLFTAKPVVYLVNVSEKSWRKKGAKWLKPIKKWVKRHSKGSKVIPFSAKFEQKYADLETEEEKAAFLEEADVPSHFTKIILAGYKALGLIHFFTVGADEVKCWTIRQGTKAPGAAGVIHTDFERGFICAKTMSYEDFMASGGSEAACKAAGTFRQEGRNYVAQDGDIFHFEFNVR